MESLPPPPTLATLPPPVLAKVVENLRSDDRIRLRGVSTFFTNFIPQFTTKELVQIELEEWARAEKLLACGGCLRLRRGHCFDRLMRQEPEYYSGLYHFVEKIGYPFMNRGGALAYMRFCDDCGRRPLPGPFRYRQGEYFHEECPYRIGGSLVRCKRCGKDAKPPPGDEMWPWHVYEIRRGVRPGLCADCHGVVEERSGTMDGEKRPSLMDLPENLHLAIAANMRLDTRERLRKASRYFRTIIPAPTHAELLAAEKEDWSHSYWHLLACGGCVRLRKEKEFAPQMKYGYRNPQEEKEFDPRMARGGAFAHVRFCNDCGVRPLPGTFRYMLGEHWSDNEKKRPAERCARCWLEMDTAIDYVKCKKCDPCDNIKEAPHCIHVGLCTVHYDEGKKVKKQEEDKQSSVPVAGHSQVISRDLLTTLDLDVLAIIVSQLGSEDQMTLRGVCTFFNEFIPRFLHEDLLQVELEEWAISKSLLACGGCVRLRQQSKFGYRVVYCDDWEFGGWIVPYRGGSNARKRYCNDCGIRDLPGEYRYPEDARWLYDEEGNLEAEFVRCRRTCCGNITLSPKGIYDGVGETCHHKGTWGCGPYPNTVLDAEFPKHMFKIKQYFGRPLITCLPAELILSIAEYLRLDELMLLRGVSRVFYIIIPALTHQQLLVAETEDWATMVKDRCQLLACGGCQRLRRESKFNGKFFDQATSRWELSYPGFEAGGPRAAERFCNSCGLRKLPGNFRYWPGAHINSEEVGEKNHQPLVRCKRCGMDRRPPFRNQEFPSRHHYYIEIGLCEPCYVETHGRTSIKKNTYALSKFEGLSEGLIYGIIRHLEFPDRQALRLVSHNLKYDIPRPTLHQIFLAEQEEWAISKGLLCCGGCVRLRHESRFNKRMITESRISEENNLYAGMHCGGVRGHRRFCNECGIRPLPGKYRYQLGHHWFDEEKHKEVVRCKACGLDKEPAPGIDKGLCADCGDMVEEDELPDRWDLHTVEMYW